MKKIPALLLILCVLLSGCAMKTEIPARFKDAEEIVFDGDGITVNGTAISEDPTDAVYAAHDIVYYQEGRDLSYGEGTEKDAHSEEEADGHTVIHIGKAGTYVLKGTLSAGQIAVDLGEKAKADKNAVVTLVLSDAEITCSVAPAIIFYNVYECDTEEEPDRNIDTSAAGANIYIADGTENRIEGSYVARIYDASSVVLSTDGKEVRTAEKLHKYDGALYSKMSMNVDGDSGVLEIAAENEGLCSEHHLTVNGGNIRITSGDDGINTNEEGVSVTTVNGGHLWIEVLGTTGEGDGIDSNGWLVINGGTVEAFACASSGDAGVDSDVGIYLNGGTLAASGNMLDRISGGEQTYAVFQFEEKQKGGSEYVLKNAEGEIAAEVETVNDFSILILAGDRLEEGEYTLWCNEVQMEGTSSASFGGGKPMNGDAQPPEGMERPETAEGEPPEGMERPETAEGEPPEGMKRPETAEGEPPEGMEPPAGTGFFKEQGGAMDQNAEYSEIFMIRKGGNMFSFVSAAE